MYSKILVPVDLSHDDIGSKILKMADLLREKGGEIIAMHVVPVMPTYAEAYMAGDLYQESSKEAMEALKKVIAASGVKATPMIDVGVPHVAILDEQKKLDVDLVIVGSHKPGLSDYFLGSTAARVVRHAQCSVLVDR